MGIKWKRSEFLLWKVDNPGTSGRAFIQKGNGVK
ncbi:hypothetical protein RUMOBE_01518 [Blautia obeum ATCC 29174]|uniref:Uncharacterized protein n=1 Tax=Blautia obeum ATCC 29174 TaxID=411459 RepID=A5ZR91_9FIRM|nr:hypothetical protein RUMOBE_01518 [Blautia obeum ATCC 29174]